MNYKNTKIEENELLQKQRSRSVNYKRIKLKEFYYYKRTKID